MAQQQRGEQGETEQAGRQDGELVEGDVQVLQERERREGSRQRGEEAWQGNPLGVMETVAFMGRSRRKER